MTDAAVSKPRSAKWRSIAINTVLLVAVIAGVRAWQQRDMVSGAAPVLQGITLAGHSYTLPSHPARPVLVHFWATWCPICRTEQNSIVGIVHDNPDMITIAMQSGKPEEVARYMREQGIDFAVVNDADGSISNAWGVHAVPASFIIAPDGKIHFVEVGYTTGIGLRLRLWLAGYELNLKLSCLKGDDCDRQQPFRNTIFMRLQNGRSERGTYSDCSLKPKTTHSFENPDLFQFALDKIQQQFA